MQNILRTEIKSYRTDQFTDDAMDSKFFDEVERS